MKLLPTMQHDEKSLVFGAFAPQGALKTREFSGLLTFIFLFNLFNNNRNYLFKTEPCNYGYLILIIFSFFNKYNKRINSYLF